MVYTNITTYRFMFIFHKYKTHTNSPTKLLRRFFGNSTIHLRKSFLLASGIAHIPMKNRVF